MMQLGYNCLRGRRGSIWSCLVLLVCLSIGGAVADSPKSMKGHAIIDVHVHPIGKPQAIRSSTKKALEYMNRHGIQKMILSSPPRNAEKKQFDYTHLAPLVKGKKRFGFLGGGSLNPLLHSHRTGEEYLRAFAATAHEIADYGAAGYGEIAALHIALTKGHLYEYQPPDHPMLMKLADIAAETGLPIELHMDAVDGTVDVPQQAEFAGTPANLPDTMKDFEVLLAHNRRAKIVWAHGGSDPLGDMTPDLIGRLMDKHSNLYMSLRIHGHWSKTQNKVFSGDGLQETWRALLERHPDRFVIGSDTFLIPPKLPSNAAPRFFARQNDDVLKSTNEFLSLLPPALARKIARENAIRIYNLKPGGKKQLARKAAAGNATNALSDSKIREIVEGNTLTFAAPASGKRMSVHFGADGRAEIKVAGRQKTFFKDWKIMKNGMLCRAMGKQNKQHCTRVAQTEAADRLKLWNKKARYEAELSTGRQLR